MTLFLIDGNSYAYRAFYAIKGLTNSKGQPTNAVFGFTKMLLRVLKIENPDYIAVVFDFPAPTFRHKEFKEYKLDRQPMPEDLKLQFGLIKEVLKAMNISIFEKEGFEADDILATLAKKAESKGIKTKIMTSDKDILQLVNETIKVVRDASAIPSAYKEDLIYDRAKVKEKFNVEPEKIPDFLALMGDKADNMPGISGIGEKTAASLISKFKSLEGIISNINLIENEKIKDEIETNKDRLFLIRKLLKLVEDVPIDFDFESLRIASLDVGKLGNLFLELNFKSILNDLPPLRDLRQTAEAAGLAEVNELKLKEKLKNIKFDIEIAGYLLGRKYKSDNLYNSIDSIMDLSTILINELKEKNMFKLFEEIEIPLVDILAEMEENGIKIDLEFLKGYSKILEDNLKSLSKEVYNLAGEEFNINSPQQLSKILFEKLRMPKMKKTKSGYSTAGDVLENLAGKFELPAKILDYRLIFKLKSTYVDAFPELISAKTGKIHTSFNQTVTSTGRLSSSNPNLQNIPIKTDIGRLLRKAFIPSSKEFLFVSADYSQIDLRVLAHVSEDESLIDSFNKDEDIHSATAAEIFCKKINEITQSERRIAKTVNFGIIYGMSPFGLSKELKINRNDAKIYIDNYFKKYEGVKKYIEETINATRESGFVSTIFERRRYMPDINSKNKVISQFAERAAINMPIQGTAADIIKLAMINLNSKIKELNIRMLVQVHDELLFEVPQNKLDEAKEIIKGTMENVVKLKVPLKIDIKTGNNWYEIH